MIYLLSSIGIAGTLAVIGYSISVTPLAGIAPVVSLLGIYWLIFKF